MKSAMLIVLLCVFACGKKEDTCRSRESMRIECQAQNAPHYGQPYTNEMCNRSYYADRCY